VGRGAGSFCTRCTRCTRCTSASASKAQTYVAICSSSTVNYAMTQRWAARIVTELRLVHNL
jgi:hypothetical protein